MRSQLNLFRRRSHPEDLIVTPFAQILASLRTVRANYIHLTNVPAKYVYCTHLLKLAILCDPFSFFKGIDMRAEHRPPTMLLSYPTGRRALVKLAAGKSL